MRKKKAADKNYKAVASFTLAFEIDDLLNLVVEAQSEEWPDGLAWKIAKQLQEKFQPCDTMELVDEKIAMNNVKMKRNEDPKRAFERVKSVETMCDAKTKKTQEDEKWQ